MIAPKETRLTYRQSTIRIVNQTQTVAIYRESTPDGSDGHLQVSRANWTDGEIVRLVMESIDRCYNKHERMKNQRQSDALPAQRISMVRKQREQGKSWIVNLLLVKESYPISRFQNAKGKGKR